MRRLILAIGAVSLLACSDSSGPGAGSAVGTWNLVSIDGDPLPYTYFQVGTTVRAEIVSVRLVALSNGTYTATSTDRETNSGVVTTTTQTDTGTWAQSGAAVTLRSDDDGSFATAAISGDVATMNEDGVVFIYHRE